MQSAPANLPSLWTLALLRTWGFLPTQRPYTPLQSWSPLEIRTRYRTPSLVLRFASCPYTRTTAICTYHRSASLCLGRRRWGFLTNQELSRICKRIPRFQPSQQNRYDNHRRTDQAQDQSQGIEQRSRPDKALFVKIVYNRAGSGLPRKTMWASLLQGLRGGGGGRYAR